MSEEDVEALKRVLSSARKELEKGNAKHAHAFYVRALGIVERLAERAQTTEERLMYIALREKLVAVIRELESRMGASHERGAT